MRRAVLVATLCGTSVAFRSALPRTALSSTCPCRGGTTRSLRNPAATTAVGAVAAAAVAPRRWSSRSGTHACLARCGGGIERLRRDELGTVLYSSVGGDGDETTSNPKGEESEVEAAKSGGLPPRGGMKGTMDKLKGYGSAGVIAYGLLNQLYYSIAFAFLWLGPMGAAAIAAPVTAGMRGTVGASAKQFGKVAALVWLGSQATKPLRIALAVVLAPAAELVLASTERRLRLPSRRYAFWVLFAAILGSAMTFCAAAVSYAAIRTAAATAAPASSLSASSAAIFLTNGTGGLGGRSGAWFSRLTGSRGHNPARERLAWAVRPAGSSGFQGDVVRLAHRAPREEGKRGQGGQAVGMSAQPTASTLRPPTGGKVTAVGSSPTEAGRGSGTTPKKAGGRRMSPQKAADKNPPPQDNIHGWNQHPKHLLGVWVVGAAEALPAPEDGWAEEAVAAAAPSVAAAAALAAAATAVTGHSGEQVEELVHPGDDFEGSSAARLEAGGFSYRETADRDMVDLGSDILHHVKYVVLRRGGKLKVGPPSLGVGPRSWRFTPANRRIVFEVDVPGRGVALRYTGKLKRLPGKFTRVKGIVRVRPSSHAAGDWEIPASSRLWPKLASFDMELDLPDKFRHTD